VDEVRRRRVSYRENGSSEKVLKNQQLGIQALDKDL
jgi:hypothetical protein